MIEEANAGLTADSGNPEALAKIVLQMYQLDAEQRRQMGLNGRQYFDKHFKREVLLKNLEDWMYELTEKNSR